jgi:beta-1,4-N-acetylglucosaminyltransferase
LNGIVIDCYDFKPDLRDDITSADLIISHCGAGSILEILRAKKKAIGVINSNLLDNHQVELADKMEECGYMALARTPEDLVTVLSGFDSRALIEYPAANPRLIFEEVSRLIRFP